MAKFIVTIQGKSNHVQIHEVVFADNSVHAKQIMVGTPDTLGRYAYRSYDIIAVEERTGQDDWYCETETTLSNDNLYRAAEIDPYYD